MEAPKHENLVLAFNFYVEDNWYGKHYRYIYNGPDGQGFKTKGEANKYSPMMKKYILYKQPNLAAFCYKNKVGDGQKLIIKLDECITYKYCGAGPSYACTNIHIDHFDFMDFIEKEKVALGERKVKREQEAEIRENYKESKKYRWSKTSKFTL